MHFVSKDTTKRNNKKMKMSRRREKKNSNFADVSFFKINHFKTF